MVYDEETRRFNLLSGLVCGAVLGAGLGLLLLPQKGVRRPRARRHLSGRVAEGVEALRSRAPRR